MEQTKEKAWSSKYSLVLLPGLDGTGLLFEPFKSCFPNQEKLVVVNYPTDRSLDYDHLAEIVRQRIPTSGSFVLLAESFSGPVAARLLDHPRLSGLILCASFLHTPRSVLLRVLARLPLSLLLRVYCPTFILRFACLGNNCPNSTVKLFRSAIKNVQPSVLEYRLRLLSDFNDLRKIAQTKAPICYLLPSKDKLLPSSCAKDICDSGASVVVRKVKGPHFLLQSSPEEAVAAICEFGNGLCEQI